MEDHPGPKQLLLLITGLRQLLPLAEHSDLKLLLLLITGLKPLLLLITGLKPLLLLITGLKKLLLLILVLLQYPWLPRAAPDLSQSAPLFKIVPGREMVIVGIDAIVELMGIVYFGQDGYLVGRDGCFY